MGHSVAQSHKVKCLDSKVFAFMAGYSGVYEREGDVFQCGISGQQVKCLKDKAYLLIADFREPVVCHLADVSSVKDILSFSGCIEASEDIHQC